MEHRITVNFNARYETLGKAHQETEELWLVCHGHGQLAKYFIKKFNPLDNGKRLIVAPEGLFKYYLQGFSGRVGATWMTKEDRESDIQNYLSYLKAVLKEVKSTLPDTVKVTLLGFSQGAATISRLATQTDIDFDKLILWAGIFPPDLPPLESKNKLSNKPCYLVYGTKDPYLTDARILEQQNIADHLSIKPEILTFNGEHEMHSVTLLNLCQSLDTHP